MLEKLNFPEPCAKPSATGLKFPLKFPGLTPLVGFGVVG